MFGAEELAQSLNCGVRVGLVVPGLRKRVGKGVGGGGGGGGGGGVRRCGGNYQHIMHGTGVVGGVRCLEGSSR